MKVDNEFAALLQAVPQQQVAQIVALFAKKLNVKFVFNAVEMCIGHLACNTYHYILLNQRGIYDEIPIFVYRKGYSTNGTQVANKFLVDLMSRGYITLHLEDELFHLIKKLSQQLGLFRDVFYINPDVETPEINKDIYDFEILPLDARAKLWRSHLEHRELLTSFSFDELEQGEKLKAEMGIGPTDWHVNFSARDHAHYKKMCEIGIWNPERAKTPDVNTDSRNSDINACLDAAEYITQQGGFGVRVGFAVEKALETNNPKIIDYASHFRTEFGDVYLAATAKFILGGLSGLTNFPPVCFGTPAALYNTYLLKSSGGTNIPYAAENPEETQDYHCSKMLSYPMKVFSKKTNRYLTMSETLDTPEIQDTLNGHLKSTFDQLDLEIILCSQEEILALAIEMNERIDGTYVVSEEERKLRNKAEMIIMEKNGQLSGYNTFAGHFLLHNQELIN